MRPDGYVSIPYAPVSKIDTEEKMKDIAQTPLEHSYTMWVKIQEQNFNKKGAKFDGDELKEIDTFETVSIQIIMYFTNIFSFRSRNSGYSNSI